MAWSFTDIESHETTRLALDKPLIAASVIPVNPTSKWIEDASFASDTLANLTDRSATNNPARFAYDGYVQYMSKPGASPTDDVWHFCFDLGAAYTFDCAFITSHNLGTLNLGNDVLLKIADNTNFTTSLTTIGNFGTPAANDDSRLYDLSLAHGADGGRAHDTAADAGPNRYTAQYVCVTVDKTGTNIIPQIGELILGRRRQLEYKPTRPYDNIALSENAEMLDTLDGEIHKTIYARRGFRLAGDLLISSDTYRDDLVAFFRQCTGAFVWIEDPSSAPSSYRIMVRQGPLDMPNTDANVRQHRIVATEQGPQSYYLDVEANG